MLILLFVVAITSVASAANLNIEKIKTLGDLKHKVIFQSSDYEFDKNSNILRTLVVARWGTEVFEMANVYFRCSKDNNCKYASYKTVKMFKSCAVTNSVVTCQQAISGNYDYSNGSSDVIVYENPDEVKGDYDNSREGYEQYPEFPARDNEEYKDMF